MVLAWVFLKVVDDFNGLGADEWVANLSQELALNLFSIAAVIAMRMPYACCPRLTWPCSWALPTWTRGSSPRPP